MLKITKIDNILTNNSLGTILTTVAHKMRAKRKAAKFSQAELAQHSGVSLGSIKRFERIGEISLSSLVKIAIVLDSTEAFEQLFALEHYHSIEDVLMEKKNKHGT